MVDIVQAFTLDSVLQSSFGFGTLFLQNPLSIIVQNFTNRLRCVLMASRKCRLSGLPLRIVITVVDIKNN